MEENKSAETQKPKSKVREWTETILWAVLIALIIRAVLVQAYKIPTGSMQPTLRGAEDYKIGDHLLVNKFLYGSVIDIPFTTIHFPRLPAIRSPKRGDVVVFKYPEDPRKDYVKRCIGLPGETVEIRNKVVYIDGKPLDEPWLRRFPKRMHFADGENIYPAHLSPRDNFGPLKIPEGQFFVMGDNRDNSADSRFWGLLKYQFLRGQAVVVYWPPQRIRVIH